MRQFWIYSASPSIASLPLVWWAPLYGKTHWLYSKYQTRLRLPGDIFFIFSASPGITSISLLWCAPLYGKTLWLYSKYQTRLKLLGNNFFIFFASPGITTISLLCYAPLYGKTLWLYSKYQTRLKLPGDNFAFFLPHPVSHPFPCFDVLLSMERLSNFILNIRQGWNFRETISQFFFASPCIASFPCSISG